MTRFRTPYVDYDVLAKWDTPSWDDQTREVLRKRLTRIPARRFFSDTEWRTLEAVCGRLVPQPERSDPIPIVPWIDEKLHHNWRDGFRYDDMPPLRAAWRLGLEGIDYESRRRFGADFRSLPEAEQDAVLRAIQAGDVDGELWARLPAQRFFTTVLLKEVVGEYYAHPAAWSEVGFGGPASPRGYVRLGSNQRDPWEAPERDDQEAHRE
jgi:gluconate 2-dehydrogenase subunit 3-like protein